MRNQRLTSYWIIRKAEVPNIIAWIDTTKSCYKVIKTPYLQFRLTGRQLYVSQFNLYMSINYTSIICKYSINVSTRLMAIGLVSSFFLFSVYQDESPESGDTRCRSLSHEMEKRFRVLSKKGYRPGAKIVGRRRSGYLLFSMSLTLKK